MTTYLHACCSTPTVEPHASWCPVPEVDALPEITVEHMRAALIDLHAQLYNGKPADKRWNVALERAAALGRRLQSGT